MEKFSIRLLRKGGKRMRPNNLLPNRETESPAESGRLENSSLPIKPINFHKTIA